MNRLFIQILLVSMILLLGFQAWGEPKPKTLAGANQEFPQFTIAGNLFGVAPEIGLSGELVSSTEGLRNCVLLADSPILGKSKHMEILAVKQCDTTSITFISGVKVPAESKSLFIFVMDGEGNPSLPVGPLNVVDGQPSFDAQTFDLLEASYKIGEGNSVQVLQPYLDPANRPGQPGQPMHQ